MFLRVTLPLAGANFLNQAARTVMAIVGPVLAVEFGLSASELGLLAACMFFAYAVVQLPLGVALDVIGPRKMQTGLMLVAASGFALFAVSSGMTGFTAARVILGVGISAGLMAIIKGNSQRFEPAKVAGMTGIAMAFATLGSVLATAPAQWALPTLGWRGIFWVMCAMALAVSAWIFFTVPDKPAPAQRKSLGEELAVMGGILRSGMFWRYAPFPALMSVFNFAYMGLWAGPWLRDVAGFDGAARAQVLLGYTLAALAGNALIGQWTSREVVRGRSPFFVPLICMGFVIAGQAALAFQPSTVAAVYAVWLVLAFFGASGSSGYIAVGQMFPKEQMGRVSTASNLLTLGAAFLLQAAIGRVLDLFPRTATGGWSPEGYSWALGLSMLIQVLATANMLAGGRK
jgi:predicted MFS family arabinose efflux permease